VPYVTTIRNGTASTVPDYTTIGPANFIVAGGGANGGAVDNGEGSSRDVDVDDVRVHGRARPPL
jgi:hypothetical protein